MPWNGDSAMKLNLQQLTKCFGETRALDELSLSVEAAGVLVLIGPSGGGKSTLLRVLGGLETVDSGIVEINGQPLHTEREALLAYRRKNGFLFQQFNLFPHLTARTNIALPLEKVHGHSADEAQAIAIRELERFDLLSHADKLPSQLSGGQQQRVGIARAVSNQPEILFLDEPTSALDPEMTAEVLELIQDLALSGQKIILSTHEMGFARAIADQVAFVAAGKIEEVAPPSEIFDSPESALCRRFLSRVMRF